MPLQIDFSKVGNAIANGLESIGTYSAKAAAQANSISQQAQSAQGAFNQASANQANMLNDQSIASQYGFNSAMMSAANEYNTEAWNQAAAWNEKMWQKQADFNAEQAQLNRDFNAAEAQKLRDWQTNMANTSYQRAMADMSAAGLNPILAYSQGGANVPGGAAGSGTAASVGGAQMTSATAQMASGGLLGANMASESNFTGQMEQMSSTLALLGAVFSGISSAADAAGGLGEAGESIMDGVSNMMSAATGNGYYKQPDYDSFDAGNETLNSVIKWIGDNVPNPVNMINQIKKGYDSAKNTWTKEDTRQFNAYKNKQRSQVHARFKEPING